MRHIFLSPHFDDLALSCGGWLHKLARTGHPTLALTVFAQAPATGQPLSRMARRLHTHMGGAAVAATRDAEDRAAMRILGAERATLPFLEAMYRPAAHGGWRYPNMRALFGQPHVDDEPLCTAVTEAIGARTVLGRDAYYAPLGVGGHVDHALLNQIGHQLHKNGARVAFYEDYPYADPDHQNAGPPEHRATLERVLGAPRHARLVSEFRLLDDTDVDARIAAILAYPSQLGVLFRERTGIAHRIRTAVARRGESSPSERFWRPRPSE